MSCSAGRKSVDRLRQLGVAPGDVFNWPHSRLAVGTACHHRVMGDSSHRFALGAWRGCGHRRPSKMRFVSCTFRGVGPTGGVGAHSWRSAAVGRGARVDQLCGERTALCVVPELIHTGSSRTSQWVLNSNTTRTIIDHASQVVTVGMLKRTTHQLPSGPLC